MSKDARARCISFPLLIMAYVYCVTNNYTVLSYMVGLELSCMIIMSFLENFNE